MKNYWYTLLLTITLSSACFSRIIPGFLAETMPQTTAETISETSHESSKSEMIPETSPEIASEVFIQETVPQSAPETPVPETVPETSMAPHLASNPDFKNVLFIGDSRTAGLSEYGNLGEAEVFANSGMSVFQLFDSSVKTRHHGKTSLREILSQTRFQTIYLMLGINELGYEYNSIIKKYTSVVETIQTLQPDAVIVLEANLHVTAKKASGNSIYNNENINRLNQGIREIADSHSCLYLDVNPIFDDENGNLREDYSADGSHILGKHYASWVEWLKEQ